MAEGVDGISVTSSTPRAVHETGRYDSRICYITAAAHFHKKAGSILIIGGEKFSLVRFDEYGEYLNYRSNTSCAAGTGSFLDQQAKRLNLKGIEEFSEISFRNTGEIPKIASRCSVFAKTDLIHAQQEGFRSRKYATGFHTAWQEMWRTPCSATRISTAADLRRRSFKEQSGRQTYREYGRDEGGDR